MITISKNTFIRLMVLFDRAAWHLHHYENDAESQNLVKEMKVVKDDVENGLIWDSTKHNFKFNKKQSVVALDYDEPPKECGGIIVDRWLEENDDGELAEVYTVLVTLENKLQHCEFPVSRLTEVGSGNDL